MIYTPIGLHLIKADSKQKRWPSYAIELNLRCGEGGSPFAYFTKVALIKGKRRRIDDGIVCGKRGDQHFQRREKALRG